MGCRQDGGGDPDKVDDGAEPGDKRLKSADSARFRSTIRPSPGSACAW